MAAWFWTSLMLWAVLALVVHELGHILAAWRYGIRVTEIHLGVGRALGRLGPVTIRAWPLGLGVEIPDEDMASAPPRARVVVHAGGPLANLALAALLAPAAPLGTYVNVLMGASNLLPLPFQDGGWLVSLLIHPGDYGAEIRWHRRLAAPLWALGASGMVALAVWRA